MCLQKYYDLHYRIFKWNDLAVLLTRTPNLHGTYDLSNLLSAIDPDYSLEDVINFKSA
ncbi:protein of unknown function (plasmid) [Legionella fallonii LLAP-10]|uniref:Uncharacterized protein n=1 Tax=Legionella fallonii LLAP-10 TaxID=1212491 RepID=A0A098GBB5_9GAMM|nr:protein of unknown function [Legionella fallonii LLAP-10]CEG59272.1 protein of unknown function [Legionella fallonii LLAP-10]